MASLHKKRVMSILPFCHSLFLSMLKELQDRSVQFPICGSKQWRRSVKTNNHAIKRIACKVRHYAARLLDDQHPRRIVKGTRHCCSCEHTDGTRCEIREIKCRGPEAAYAFCRIDDRHDTWDIPCRR